MTDEFTPSPGGRPNASRPNPEIGALLLARPTIAGHIVAAEIRIELSGCVVPGILSRPQKEAWVFRAEALPPWLVASPGDQRKIEAEILDTLLIFAPDFMADAVEAVRDKCLRDELCDELRMMAQRTRR